MKLSINLRNWGPYSTRELVLEFARAVAKPLPAAPPRAHREKKTKEDNVFCCSHSPSTAIQSFCLAP